MQRTEQSLLRLSNKSETLWIYFTKIITFFFKKCLKTFFFFVYEYLIFWPEQKNVRTCDPFWNICRSKNWCGYILYTYRVIKIVFDIVLNKKFCVIFCSVLYGRILVMRYSKFRFTEGTHIKNNKIIIIKKFFLRRLGRQSLLYNTLSNAHGFNEV